MLAIVNAAHCSVAPAAGGAWLVTKTGGDPAAADASAVSAAPIEGDFVLRMRTLGSALLYAGAAADTAGDGFPTIDWALQLQNSLVRVYESGVYRPSAFTMSGHVWIRRQGGTLAYLVGAQLAAATVRRTVAGVAGPLWFDCSIVTPGVALEVKFDAPGAFTPRRARRPGLALGIGL